MVMEFNPRFDWIQSLCCFILSPVTPTSVGTNEASLELQLPLKLLYEPHSTELSS